MEFSSIDQSRFAKYSIIIKKKNTKEITNSELDALNIDERRIEQFVHEYRNIKVADLLKLVGEDERYQKIMLALLCLLYFSYAFIAFMIPYVFYAPTFLCYDEHKNKNACSQAEACSNPYGFEIQAPIVSVITEYKLYCSRRSLLDFSEASFVVSGGFVAFFLGIISDRIGRKKVFIISYILTIVGTLTAVLAPNLTFIVLGNIFSWSGMDTFFAMAFIYCNEIIGGDLRSKSNGFLFFSWGLGEILINILNIWIPHYRYNFLIQCVPFLLLGFTYLILQESPYVLYKLKDIGELYKVLKYIGMKNERDEAWIERELDKQLAIDKVMTQRLENIDSFRLKRLNPSQDNELKGHMRRFRKFCQDQSIIFRLVGVTMIAGNIYIGYSLSLLIPQRLGLKSIHLNGIFLGVSEIISYILVIPIGSVVKRRHLNFFCASFIVVMDVLLIIGDLTAESWPHQTLRWFQTLVSCIIKLVFCINYALIFSYCSELFPTKIRGFTLGLCVFFGRAMVVFAFYLQNVTDYFQIHPMIGTIFGSLIVIPISLFLPETVGSGISN